ncbi:hypothetical protein BCT31_13885 [Vibrio lentus]|uniref:hypothetical protein n=1 Tax=Vibrio lentus TaxID=136468 RepID=UPI000CB3BBD1|nr:hypothetical protein [Vibrio lentus]PMN52657.1 hypothetical protein BCT31_13885 [Vibrio lentus]
MRELLAHPSSEEFTQGSIFEGLNLNQDHSHGIVVTARCDIANGKARNILCLPVYKADDWIKNQGNEIIYRKLENRLENKLKTEFSKFKISIELLSTYPITSIKGVIDNNKGKKSTEDVYKLLDMYEKKTCDYSLKFVSDERKSLISSIIKNQEASIYFLEQIELDKVLEPYIIDLSDPVSIPFPIALKLLRGINQKSIDNTISQYLTVYKSEISYISELRSPYIEHLLQKFSTFYSRIGTEDIEKDAEQILKEKLNDI